MITSINLKALSGAIVWAYMYNGNMQTIAVQHQ